MLKGVYRVMARWYNQSDNTGESYVLTSNNSVENTNLEVGRRVHVIFSKSGNYALESAMDNVYSLLEDINKLQSVGIDGKKFLVVGSDNDLAKLQKEVKEVLALIDTFNG